VLSNNGCLQVSLIIMLTLLALVLMIVSVKLECCQ
jgi:hypothetical protein